MENEQQEFPPIGASGEYILPHLKREKQLARWKAIGTYAVVGLVLAGAAGGIGIVVLQGAGPPFVAGPAAKSSSSEGPEAAGYHVAVEGQKHHHGVAIASRLGLAEVVNGLADGKAEPEARLLSATVGGLRILSVYAPHGREVGSASYQEKLTWMARLRSHLDARYRPDIRSLSAATSTSPPSRGMSTTPSSGSDGFISTPRREPA